MQASVKGVVAPSSDPIEMLISRIVEHEGIRKSAYEDSLGFLTIGVGRLIDSRKQAGLSVDECFYLLRNDLDECRKQLQPYDWFNKNDETRKGALIELCFNLGLDGLLGFKDMISFLYVNNYSGAVKSLLDSKWAMEVGVVRSTDIAYRLQLGRYK